MRFNTFTCIYFHVSNIDLIVLRDTSKENIIKKLSLNLIQDFKEGRWGVQDHVDVSAKKRHSTSVIGP